MKKILIFLLMTLVSQLLGDELTIGTRDIWPADCEFCEVEEERAEEACNEPFQAENVIVDLIDPLYLNGTLTTEKGGVLRAPGIRIQARKIIYTRKEDEDPPIFSVHCEDDLLIDYKGQILVGKSLDYDFFSGSGCLIDGRMSLSPWQIGGKEIHLQNSGKMTIHNGYIKTSEGKDDDWAIVAPKMVICKNQILSAQNISFQLRKVPIFWLPKMKLDLQGFQDSPIAFKASWGGFPGSSLSARYQFLSWNDLDAYLRVDGYLKRGFGAGIETEFAPKHENIEFYTRNYYAHDISIFDPVRRDRYRFEGTYYQYFCKDNLSVSLLYDKVSDPDMAADYQARDFDLLTAGRTELDLLLIQQDWIADFYTNLRVNDFQTVNQQLPSFFTTYHPLEIAHTGIIFENRFTASYRDYAFGNDVIRRKDRGGLHAARLETYPAIYRPFYLGPFTATPRLGFIGIGYSNSPEKEAVGQLVGEAGLDINTALHQYYGSYKHVVEPYAEYLFLTSPKVPVDRYFVFDINDAYAHLNQCRFGMRQSLFVANDCVIHRPLYLDIFGLALINAKAYHTDLPKAYACMEWAPWDTLCMGIDTAWNFDESLLDFYNYRVDWTFSPNLALAFEYRHRSRFDWRKADHWDFILDSARSEESLLHSPLSDRRDTLLTIIFYRFHPDWSVKFQMRHGWGRIHQPGYTEYQIDLATILKDQFHVHFIYDKREFEHRFSMSFKLNRNKK